MLRDPTDGKPGLRIETAAGAVARDAVRQHFAAFGLVTRVDRVAGQQVVAAYVDALAGALALVIAGRHASKDDVVNATITTLREAVERDLKHMKVK